MLQSREILNMKGQIMGDFLGRIIFGRSWEILQEQGGIFSLESIKNKPYDWFMCFTDIFVFVMFFFSFIFLGESYGWGFAGMAAFPFVTAYHTKIAEATLIPATITAIWVWIATAIMFVCYFHDEWGWFK